MTIDLEQFTGHIADDDAWLIVKRDLFYMPGGKGYTGIRDNAGRYSHEEAKRHESPNENGIPVTIIKLTEAPEFTRACYDDLALAHVQKQRDALLSEVRRLKEALEKIAERGHDDAEWYSNKAFREIGDIARSALSSSPVEKEG